MDYKKHIDNLIDISNKIKVGEISILTGHNGAGKSLIRKILPGGIADQLGKKLEDGNVCAATSQEARTGSNPEWGALAGVMRDVAWTPTSTETLDNIKQLLKVDDRFITVDEPEIGMGEETVAGLVKYLNEMLPTVQNKGMLFITHNRYIVENLKIDSFYNLEGMTKEEWLNRKIEPTDLEELKDRSLELFRAVQKRIDENKEKRNK